MTVTSIFFLGATGFVGRNLAQNLLKQGHRLLCLLRPGPSASGQQRLRAALAPFFPDGTLEALERTQLEVFEGDIADPCFGLKPRTYDRLLREAEEIWHCAASLSFDERHRREAERINVGGTRQVLEFARAARARRLNYLSTAYVAGRRQGHIREGDLNGAYGFKNPYEHSKWQAERLIRDFVLGGGVAATIYRPAIIVGDTKPGTECASGVYRVAQIITALAAKYGLNRRGREPAPTLRLPGARDCCLNLVPIDYVVQALTALAAREDTAGLVFHLTNPRPLSNPEAVGAVGDAVGLRLEVADHWELQAEPLTGPEQVLAKAIKAYLPYLRDRVVFDTANTDEYLAGTGLACPFISRRRLAALLSYSQAAAGRPEAPDQAARPRPSGPPQAVGISSVSSGKIPVRGQSHVPPG